MSNYASISIDRREAYYQRAAALIASDQLGYHSRAEHGRVLQAGIQPKDLTLERLKAMGRKAADVLYPNFARR